MMKPRDARVLRLAPVQQTENALSSRSCYSLLISASMPCDSLPFAPRGAAPGPACGAVGRSGPRNRRRGIWGRCIEGLPDTERRRNGLRVTYRQRCLQLDIFRWHTTIFIANE